MDLPTVKVTARINDQQGKPVHSALIVMRLATTEKYCGLVVPSETRGVTDASGVAVLDVWPNELGSEGSEYLVTVSFPNSNCGNDCVMRHGADTSRPPLRTLRFHAVVPNTDCNLMDLVNLPPYEQRGAGQVITSDIAAYADSAARSAESAKSAVGEARAVEARLIAAADSAVAAKDAALEAQKSAEDAAARAERTDAEFTLRVDREVNAANKCLTDTANLKRAEAVACIKQAETTAIEAIDMRSGEALNEATVNITEAGVQAVGRVQGAGEQALFEVKAEGQKQLDQLREEGALYGEDFENLLERAASEARRAGCASTSAANSAAKACACADRAEAAAQGLERHRDDALDAARRAESAAECAKADAGRAETAAETAVSNAEFANASANEVHKHAQAADVSAEQADQSKKAAIEAKRIAEEHANYVSGVADDVKQEIHDVAMDALVPQIITDAVNKATAQAQASAAAAEAAKMEATVQADNARVSAEDAAVSQTIATDAANHADDMAAVAKECADKLQTGLQEQLNIAEMGTQLINAVDRITKVELWAISQGYKPQP